MPRIAALLVGSLTSLFASAEPLVLEIYNAASPGPAAECRSVGFNTLVVGNREGLDLCLRHGFKGVFSGLPHGHDSFDPGAVRARVESVRDHPALAGYILIDEPDLRPWSAPPSLVQSMARAVKSADPEHPVMATFQGFLGARALVKYLDAVDLIRLDSYPFFNRRPLTWAMEVLDACRAATGDRKPIGLIQQAWSDSSDFPPPEDDLCLTYLALIHGVKGIGHYAYRFGDRGKPQTLPEDEPRFWSSLRTTTAHLSALGELRDPPPNARVLCSSVSGRVDWALRERNGETLLFLCNPTTLPDTAILKTPDAEGDVASFVLGRRPHDYSAEGTSIPMRPREVRLLRVSGASPPPLSESVLPITLELHHLGASSNAYERVLIRNSYPALENCRLVIRDLCTGLKVETLTDVPGNAAAERVVYVEEPVTQRLVRGCTVGLELRDQDYALYTRTVYHPSGTSIGNGAYRGRARVCGELPLERGRECVIETEMALPAGDEISAVTAQYFAPGLSEIPEHVVAPEGRTATASFSISVPADLCGERYEGFVRWIVPDWSATGDSWIPLSLAVRPVIELEQAESPRFVEQGGEEILTFHFSSTRKRQTAACSLDLPEGWSNMGEVVSRPAPADDGSFLVSYRIQAPRDRFARSLGSLTFGFADQAKHALPVEFSVPLVAGATDQAVDFFDDVVWDHAKVHQLVQGSTGDLEGGLKLLWNRQGLAIRCAVTDNEHFINSGEGGVWRGDSLQVSVLAMRKLYRTPEMGDPGFANFGFAFDAENDKMLIDLGFVKNGIDRETALAALETRGKRENRITTYTIVIPWEAIGANVEDAKKAGRFSLLVNDYDKTDLSDRHWIEFGGGIVRGTDPQQFADLVLTY